MRRDSWAEGSTRAWRKLRRFVLNRDGGRCRFLADGQPPRSADEQGGRRCGMPAEHVHHLDPLADGHPKLCDPSRAIAACARHNLQYGDGKKAKSRNDKREATRWAW